MTYNLGATFSGPYDTDGVQTVFGFGFKIYAKTDAEVIYTNAAGIESIVPSANWTVPTTDLGKDTGGNITIPVAPVDGGKITIRLNPRKEQQTNLRNQGAYSPEAVERMADRLQMQILSLSEEVSRSIKVSISSEISTEDYLALVLSYATAASAASATAVAASGAAQIAAIQAAGHSADALAERILVEAISDASFLPYLFDTATAIAAPPAGTLRLDNATFASALTLLISATTSGGSTVGDWIKSWDDSTSIPRGVLTFKSLDNAADFVKFNVGTPVQDNGTWMSMPITFNSSSGSLSNNERISVQFAPSGNLGSVAIGGSIVSATVGSVLFVGAGGVLAQDNANIFWNNTNKSLGIGTATPSAKAVADFQSTTKGFLGIPRMTAAQMNAITSPDNSLLVHATDLKAFMYYSSSSFAWKAIFGEYAPANFFDAAYMDLFEATGNGANRGRMKAPAALGSDVDWTFPTSTGTLALTADIPASDVKAWVNFNGTGTVAINASKNVSSITDNGVGDYTVNFTVSFADAFYSANINTNQDGINQGSRLSKASISSQLAGSLRFVQRGDTLNLDASTCNVTVVR